MIVARAKARLRETEQNWASTVRPARAMKCCCLLRGFDLPKPEFLLRRLLVDWHVGEDDRLLSLQRLSRVRGPSRSATTSSSDAGDALQFWQIWERKSISRKPRQGTSVSGAEAEPGRGEKHDGACLRPFGGYGGDVTRIAVAGFGPFRSGVSMWFLGFFLFLVWGFFFPDFIKDDM
ncbi:hypothetical protein NL676_011034 [Syzygium grande]|nr:hypothetical protein NL676_011034 [Syzygium grande]